MKNNLKKIKSTKLYKPVMIVALVLVTIGLVWGSATIAKVAINGSYKDPVYMATEGSIETLYGLEDNVYTGNSRNGTLVSMLKKDDEDTEIEGVGGVYDNSPLIVNGSDTSSKSLGNAVALDELEYNIIKGVLSELNRDTSTGSLDDTKITEISNKYDISLSELERLLKQYQQDTSDDAEKMKNEMGVTEKELKSLITQIETKVTDNYTKVEQKINTVDKKTSEMIANSQTLTEKQIKELATQIGVSDKELKDYINLQDKTFLETANNKAESMDKEVLETANTNIQKSSKETLDTANASIQKSSKETLESAKKTAEEAAKAAASPKADKTYVDDQVNDAKKIAESKTDKTYVDSQVADKLTKNDLKEENVVAATLDEDSGTLTFYNVK